jgi:hypothetical protein
VSCRS